MDKRAIVNCPDEIPSQEADKFEFESFVKTGLVFELFSEFEFENCSKK